MKVFIENKLDFKGSSEVTNEEGEVVFTVQGKLFSFANKKSVLDKEGKLLYTIKNKLFNMFSHKVCIFDAEKNKVATIKKAKLSFNLDYKILDCADEMELKGKFFSGQTEIYRNGEQAGIIIREGSFVIDKFSLEAEEQDIPFFTALVVAFDNLKDEQAQDFRK